MTSRRVDLAAARRRSITVVVLSVAAVWGVAGEAPAQTEVKRDATLVETFEKEGERAEYTVKMSAGERLSLRVVGLGEDDHRRFAVILYGKEGKVLRASNVSNAVGFPPANRAEIRGVELPEAGTYSFAVENHGQPGIYRLEVGFVGDPIKPGETHEGRLDAKDRDQFKVSLKAGDRLLLEADVPEGSEFIVKVLGKDTKTILRQSDARAVPNMPGRRAQIPFFALPDNGDYLIEVENTGSMVAPYLLKVGAELSNGKRILPPSRKARRKR